MKTGTRDVISQILSQILSPDLMIPTYTHANFVLYCIPLSVAQNLEILEKLTSLGGSTFLFGYIERKKYLKYFFQNFATPPQARPRYTPCTIVGIFFFTKIAFSLWYYTPFAAKRAVLQYRQVS